MSPKNIDEWKTTPFEKCIKKTKQEKRLQSVQSHEYQKSGKYPVIDQGTKLIAGFTDNEGSIYSAPLPVVVFGDHTRVFKYVDFPFASGADGTKILVPEDNVDGRFFYFALSSLDIPNRGYNCHFKVLKDQQIKLPPSSEQQKIGELLAKTQQAIAAQQEIIDRTQEIKKALMEKLFTEGLSGEQTKETEIGPVPKNWELKRLDQLADDYSGGTPSKQQESYWIDSIPWATPKDMKVPRLKDVIDHISQEGLENGSRLVPADSIFIVVRGMILAKNIPICLNEVPMAFNQDMKALVPKKGIEGEYLLYAMQAFKHQLQQHISSAGHGTKHIGTSAIKEMLLPVPPKDDRKAIIAAFRGIEQKIDAAQSKLVSLQSLFKTLLHDLMTGRIRTTLLMEV